MDVYNKGGREFTLPKFPGEEANKCRVLLAGASMEVPDSIGESLTKHYPREIVDAAKFRSTPVANSGEKDSLIANLQARIAEAESYLAAELDKLNMEKNKEITAVKNGLEHLVEHVKTLWDSLKAHVEANAQLRASVPTGTELPEAPEVPEVPAPVAVLVPEVAQDAKGV